jgi:hypothetical protein
VVVGKKPFVLGKKGEDVLRAVYFYRYMTAVDVAHLLFSPSSLVRVRQLLFSLCGAGDFVRNQYLYRFRMPDVSAGNPERIYVLGARGREFLSGEFGFRIERTSRPDEGKHLSFSQVRHNLALTRFLVAAHRWAGESNDFKLSEVKICYDLAASSGKVEAGERGKREKAPVIPDGWLLFERAQKEVSASRYPVLVEIDRGTMYRERFKKHVGSRIEFVRGGGYKNVFGIEAVLIAYVGIAERGEEGRRETLVSWTRELLKEQRRESWGRTFRFCSVHLDEIYDSPLFAGKVWHRPDRDEPVGLFEG